MLSLETPFHTIDGVALFRDHANPLQWYYLPGTPRIAQIDGIPQISLIRFKGKAGTGGFLNLDVDLAIDPDKLANVKKQLTALEQLSGELRLSAVPVIDGTVRMFLFDAESPQPNSGGETPGSNQASKQSNDPKNASGPSFVLALRHPAKPALYGDNRAMFSAQLTQQGVTTLLQAMRGELSPIGVVYSLDFLGLRPAYHVSVQVDWELVQKHLEDHESFQVPVFYNKQIDDFVDELIEKRVIEIKADTFVAEDDGSPVIARRDEAINDLKDMITDTFFEPTLDPIDRSDKALRGAARALRVLASGGMSEFQAFSRRQLTAERIERKRLDVAMSERTTVKRTIYPQGHLSGLFRQLGAGADVNRWITDVDLDDPWFERRKLKVISRAEWDADQVRSISVTADYGGTLHSAFLTADHPEEEMSWASHLVDGGMARDVELRYQVNFSGVNSTERPRTLASETETIVADATEIDPRALYAMAPVPVVALSYPWDVYPQVQVEVSNIDASHGINQTDTFVLDADRTEQVWSRFIQDADATVAKYRITHRATDQRDVVQDWTDLDVDRIVVRDPFPRGRVVDVVPNLDWTVVKYAFVDLSYRDEAHGIVEEASLNFTPTNDGPQSFRVRLADVTRRDVNYDITIVNIDGTVEQVPTSTTHANRIMLRAGMQGHRVVGVRLADGTDFKTRKIKRVVVEFKHSDSGGDTFDHIAFSDPATTGVFEFDYADTDDYQYRVATTFTNNLTSKNPWTTSDETALVVSVG